MFADDPNMFIGTSSWSSKDWVGPFYPKGMRSSEFIRYYATKFDTVEIDATFYRMPTAQNVTAWKNNTPDAFLFAVKTPRIITHDKILLDTEDDMAYFLETISGLENKLGPVLLQFPYFNKKIFASADVFLERLNIFLEKLPKEIRFAVEVRNKNWVQKTLQDICKSHNVALAWVEHSWMPKAIQWPKLTGGASTDFAYIRWLGDRKSIEKITTHWDKTVIDQTDTINQWIPSIDSFRKEDIRVFGYFNNHFAGHGPNSIDLLGQLLNKTNEKI